MRDDTFTSRPLYDGTIPEPIKQDINPDLTNMVACHKHGVLYPKAAYCPQCDAEVKHASGIIGTYTSDTTANILGEIRNRLDRLIELVEKLL